MNTPSPEPNMPIYQFTCAVQTQHLPEQSDPARSLFSYAYEVSITNTGDVAAQLISRHWVISDASGHTEEIKGLGVVGQQPLLQPGESFSYTSGTRLRTASGAMHGSFFCVAEDGNRFDTPVAMFVLDASRADTPRVLH